MDTNVHFAKGSSQPHIPDDGQLVLYSTRFCPYAHRVHLVLNAKNLPYHVVYIDLKEKPEWYTKVNPNGKVPALQLTHETNAPILVESLLICEYLDETYPDGKLFPENAFEKANTKIWIERFGPITSIFNQLVYEQNSEEDRDKLLNEFYELLKPYEEELAKRGTTYFGGEKPGIFDYAIWPWFERFGILKAEEIAGEKFVFDDSNFPKLSAWAHVLREDAAVAKFLLSNYVHTKFSLGRRAGNPDFNILVEETATE